ncbi:putative cell wall-binding protein [Agrococcus sp. UYP33]
MAIISRALLALALAMAIVVAPLQAPAAQALSTIRYAGSDRFATSVEVSKWSDGWAGSTVFLASGLKFPDALAAGPVAAAERAHLLLTRPEYVDTTVMARIRALAPAEVVIVGSEASVSAAVADQVRTATGAQITRLGGRDRVETSLLLLDRLLAVPETTVDTIWVASGHNFPDALVAASVAGTRRHAVVLDYHDGTPSGVEAWRQRVAPYVQGRVVNIAGGGPSVSSYDEQVLRWSGTTGVFRYSGSDRYETARVINDTFNPSPSDRTMMLATGENFPDALSGAVHAALRGIPLYLTPKACHARISDMLRGEASQRGIETVVGLGTSASISDQALSLGPCPVFTAFQQAMGDRYGTFTSRSYSGTGGQVIDLDTEVYAGLITATHRGEAEFAVSALASNYEEIAQPVWHWGGYNGSVVFDGTWSWSESYMTRHLQVTADGPWTLRLDDIRHVPEFSGAAWGTGDAAYLYGAGAGVLDAQYTGDSSFVVDQRWFEDDWEYANTLILHSGNYAGSVPIQAGPGWVQIIGQGDWSVSLRQGARADDPSLQLDRSVAERELPRRAQP